MNTMMLAQPANSRASFLVGIRMVCLHRSLERESIMHLAFLLVKLGFESWGANPPPFKACFRFDLALCLFDTLLFCMAHGGEEGRVG